MSEEAVRQEAQERREGHRTLSLQIDDLSTRVNDLTQEVAKIGKGLRVLKRKAARDIHALTEELAKLNRRAFAIALAAVLAALGSIPEARSLALTIAKGLMH